MLVAVVCLLIVLVALALLVVPLLRLWRQTRALARTVADAGARITPNLPPGT